MWSTLHAFEKNGLLPMEAEEPDPYEFHDQIWLASSASSAFQLDFQPPALLPRLQAKIVAWSQRVGGASSVPEIWRGVIEVRIGTWHFTLEQVPQQGPAYPCLRLTMLQPGGAHLVLRRVEEMVDEVKRECMPHLKVFTALPVPVLDDDDVALVPVGDEPDLKIAFTIATRNRWGVAVAKGNHGLREEINAAMRASVADGSLERAWTQWMPNLTFPLHTDSADTTQ